MDNLYKHLFNQADSILIIAGAGMSADSNLPTYRGKEGFWNHYPYYRKYGKGYEGVARPSGFHSEAAASWGFYAHQYKLYSNAKPHKGYIELLNYLKNHNKKYFVITSNVDGLFMKADYSSELIHEAHGTIHKLQCSLPCKRDVWTTPSYDFEVDFETMKLTTELPKCIYCHATARPNIFMFGDNDQSYVWEESQKSAQNFQQWKKQNSQSNILILLIGVGEDGLKKHAKTYRKHFSKSKLIIINPEQQKDFLQNENTVIIQSTALSAIHNLVSSPKNDRTDS